MNDAQSPAISATAQLSRFGHEQSTLLVMDDFVDDVGALFAEACAAPFRAIEGHLYPGLRASAPDAYVKAMLAKAEPIVRAAFGFEDAELSDVECDFSIVTTPRERLQLFQCLPHFDTTNRDQIALLHYISPKNYGGTSFYRHRSTGFESINADRYDDYMRGLKEDLRSKGMPPRAYIKGDTAIFEKIGAVEAKPNRLAAYRSVNLHSGDIGDDCPFDGDPRTGRVSVNTFLQFRPSPPAASPWSALAGRGV